MKLNTKLTALAAAVSLATLLTACGSGDSSSGTDTAGIGGSGFTSSGTITGFGSVFVNGVKFETTSTTFDIEGMAGTQDDLAIGMVVQVDGILNPDGVTGTATHIIFDDELQGPVDNFVLAPDTLTATFDVLGIPVNIDSNTTYFDPDNGGIDIKTIRNGNMVELSGFFNNTGTLIASRIENKTETDENIELKGYITNLTTSKTFTLKGIPVNASTASLEGLNELTEGAFVEVEGSFDGTTITAFKVESEEFEYNDRDEFEIEGFVTHFTSHSNFKVNGIPVDASRAELEPRTMQIANNLQVEVEGRLINGILIAEEVKMRGGDVEVSAYITVDFANNRFEVTPVTGQPSLVIQTGPETQFKDDLSNHNPIRISDLREGDFVEVEGFLNDDGSIFASEVELSDPDDTEVQGVISSFTGTTITILGIEFETNNATHFESDDNSITSLDDLRSQVANGATILVEIELSNSSTNIIRKIEIED